MTKLRNYWLSLPSLLRWTLVAVFYLTLIGGYLIWQYQRPGGASLYGHNHTDRPIFSYWVDEGWGGNGGVTCCWRLQGDSLNIVWVLDVTPEQIERGLAEERLEIRVPNPPRKPTDRYLHVHFFANDKVHIAWSPDHFTPYENNHHATGLGAPESHRVSWRPQLLRE